MSNLSISERQVRGVAVVDLAGKITIGETNRQLHQAIGRLISEGKENIILNLAKVTFIDSSGLGEIVAGFSSAKRAGGSLKLINMPTRVTDLMTITKLYTIFDILDTEEEGLAAFETDQGRITQRLDPNFASESERRSSIL
jgi:anti-sigma B factor antagonist